MLIVNSKWRFRLLFSATYDLNIAPSVRDHFCRLLCRVSCPHTNKISVSVLLRTYLQKRRVSDVKSFRESQRDGGELADKVRRELEFDKHRNKCGKCRVYKPHDGVREVHLCSRAGTENHFNLN